jgi:hypothetical protein
VYYGQIEISDSQPDTSDDQIDTSKMNAGEFLRYRASNMFNFNLNIDMEAYERGYHDHDINNEIVFASDPKLIFHMHDSGGFASKELQTVSAFISQRAEATDLDAIWYGAVFSNCHLASS